METSYRPAARRRRRAERPATGGWRTGLKPEVDISKCVELPALLALLPDSAVELDGTSFTGFDLTYCKGCEICAEVCPVDAITMVPEEVVVIAAARS